MIEKGGEFLWPVSGLFQPISGVRRRRDKVASDEGILGRPASSDLGVFRESAPSGSAYSSRVMCGTTRGKAKLNRALTHHYWGLWALIAIASVCHPTNSSPTVTCLNFLFLGSTFKVTILPCSSFQSHRPIVVINGPDRGRYLGCVDRDPCWFLPPLGPPGSWPAPGAANILFVNLVLLFVPDTGDMWQNPCLIEEIFRY